MVGFNNPGLLIILLGLPIIYFAYKKAISKKKKAAMKFSNISLIKSAMGNKKVKLRNNLLFYIYIVIIGLMIIGFADLHIPLKQTKQGVNVVLAIDISGSMLATDYSPNRLEAAKRSAEVLLDSLNGKDHAGIVVFESGATTAAYLSPFREKVIEKLRSINPREGRTAIGDGLSLAIDMASSIPNKKKVVILLSDGVNNAGVITPQEAVEYAQLNEMQVYTIGLGSEEQVVLGYDWFGNPQYAELDEETLIGIAQATEGKYFKSVDSKTLDDIYKGISKDIKREKEETSIRLWIFGLVLLLLLIEFYVRYGRYRIIQ